MKLTNKISEVANKVYNRIINMVPYKHSEDILIFLKLVNTSCYSSSELDKYNQMVEELTFDCKTKKSLVNVDESNFSKWAKSNPNCVGLELWERIAQDICVNYNITIDISKIDKSCPLPNLNTTKKDITCNIGLEISKEIICTDVLTAISVNKHMCKNDIKLTRTIDECTIDYNLLLEKYPFLNLTKKEYFRLIDNKFSYKMIDCVYENDLKFEMFNDKIYLDTKYNLYDINSIDLEKIIISQNKGAKFLIQLTEDFALTTPNKQKLLNGAVYL